MQETNRIEQGQPVEAVANEIIAAPAPTTTLCSYGSRLTRDELAQVATPAGTATHKNIPHIAVVEKLIEALSFRQIGWKIRGAEHSHMTKNRHNRPMSAHSRVSEFGTP